MICVAPGVSVIDKPGWANGVLWTRPLLSPGSFNLLAISLSREILRLSTAIL